MHVRTLYDGLGQRPLRNPEPAIKFTTERRIAGKATLEVLPVHLGRAVGSAPEYFQEQFRVDGLAG